MKYYKKKDGSIWAFEDDGSQDDLITDDFTKMSKSAISAHLNPPEASPPVPSTVTMVQARFALLDAGHLQTVKDSILALPSPAGDYAREEFEYSTVVKRESKLVKAMAEMLELSDADLDALFIAASKH